MKNFALKRQIATRIIAVGALACAASSQAQTQVQTQSPGSVEKHVEVDHSDLDLRSGAGQETLDARLVRAAYQSCTPISSRSLVEKQAHNKCYADALAKARQQSVLRVAEALRPNQLAQRERAADRPAN